MNWSLKERKKKKLKNIFSLIRISRLFVKKHQKNKIEYNTIWYDTHPKQHVRLKININTCRYGTVYSVSKWITEIDGNITDQQLTRRMKQN